MKKWLVVLVAVMLASMGVLKALAASLEEPEYTVEREAEGYELRRYEPFLVAQTEVDGTFRASGNQAFRILAGYIFGDNEPGQKMAMTAPVLSSLHGPGEEPREEPGQTGREGRYIYQFVMESRFDRDSLPKPISDRVEIRQLPERWMAVHRFSGSWSEGKLYELTGELLSDLRADGLQPVSDPLLARYNGPFTPWFLRRNEILVEVEAPP